MAKKKEKRRSLVDKIRALDTEVHPQGKMVGQLFQAVAAGEIEVSIFLTFSCFVTFYHTRILHVFEMFPCLVTFFTMHARTIVNKEFCRQF